MKKAQLVLRLALAAAAFVSLDFGLNFFYNLIPQSHDGLAAHSVLHSVFGVFGDGMWSLAGFYQAFKMAVLVAAALLAVNLVLSLLEKKRRR